MQDDLWRGNKASAAAGTGLSLAILRWLREIEIENTLVLVRGLANKSLQKIIANSGFCRVK